MSNFDSLTLALEGWFDRPLCDLPEALRLRAKHELMPFSWDELAPAQRRDLALQMDYQHDPATEREREYWWDFFHRMSVLEDELQRQGSGDQANIDELFEANSPLKRIRAQIERMKERQAAAKSRYHPQRTASVQGCAPGKYMAYPKALDLLRQRLRSTAEELAAWIWLGPQDGGLAAYLNVNELDPPPRFGFDALPIFGTASEQDTDYVAPLMGCWFRSDDVAGFQPADRFITGKALIERWNSIPGLKAEAFIRSKIRESRLLDIHPLYGGTQAGDLNADYLPPMAEGLFCVADVQEIEAEDLGGFDGLASPTLAADAADAATIGPAPARGTWATDFLGLADLAPEEIHMAFVGDSAESGLAGNNMLEVSARGVVKRVSLAELGLSDRRSGALSSLGAILVGMAHGRKLPGSNENTAKVARLRKVFRASFGVREPFFPRNAADGWLPRFEIVDKRGASADRAQRDAEGKTVSLDRLLDSGARLDGGLNSEDQQESYGDAAEQWLRENDPKSK